MKKIIDQNFLQQIELSNYLIKDVKNCVLIGPINIEEMNNGNPKINFLKSLEILSKFPDQVYFIYDIPYLVFREISLKSVFISPDDLIDSETTNIFRSYLNIINSVLKGNCTNFQPINAVTSCPDGNFYKLLLQNAEITIDKLYLEQKDREQFKEGNISKKLNEFIYNNLLKICPPALDDNEFIRKKPLFLRFGASVILYCLLKKFQGGEWSSMKKKRIENQINDLKYVTLATYFDGLLTLEKDMIYIYNLLIIYLKNNY